MIWHATRLRLVTIATICSLPLVTWRLYPSVSNVTSEIRATGMISFRKDHNVMNFKIYDMAFAIADTTEVVVSARDIFFVKICQCLPFLRLQRRHCSHLRNTTRLILVIFERPDI